MARLKRALAESTAAGEREYLDLEQQLAEAERARAAACTRAAELQAALEAAGVSPRGLAAVQEGSSEGEEGSGGGSPPAAAVAAAQDGEVVQLRQQVQQLQEQLAVQRATTGQQQQQPEQMDELAAAAAASLRQELELKVQQVRLALD